MITAPAHAPQKSPVLRRSDPHGERSQQLEPAGLGVCSRLQALRRWAALCPCTSAARQTTAVYACEHQIQILF